ncbi:MAG TPA: hypothetical protein VF899_01220 [Pyrinomonadaceae bacterium]
MNKELATSTTLSHYRIVSKIGSGRMGKVYLTQDTKLDRRGRTESFGGRNYSLPAGFD